MIARMRDGWNYVSKLTPVRLGNAARVISSYYLSRITGKSSNWGLPLSISVEPTTACNLGCPECPSGLKQFSRATGNMKAEVLDQILDEIGRTTSYMIFYFQGEPFIHPGIFEMIRKASSRKIYTATSTNAHFLSPENARKTVESGLDRIIISIDGTTQEVYESYRKNGDLTKVLDGTRNLIAQKKELRSKTPHVIFQFLVVKPNEHQMEEVKALGKELGVDEVRFKTAQVYDYEHGNPLIPENEKYSRYRQLKDGRWEVKNKLEDHCWRMWHSCVITQDGIVVPCCFDKDAQHELGDLKSQRFTEIWANEKYRKFRSDLMRGRKEIDICANCSEGTKVWG